MSISPAILCQENPPADIASLRHLAQRLDTVEQLTEQAFLRLGEQVGSGQQRVTALAREAAVLLSPDTGETAGQIVMRLQLLTERCALWLDEAKRKSQEIYTLLEALQRDVSTLQNPREGLCKIVKVLQNLRVATRIEAARSDGHGALVLGQELQGLSQTMHEKIGYIAERCELLDTLLRRALQVEQQAQEGGLGVAGTEIAHARRILTGVAGQCLQTSDHTALLQRHSAQLASNFGELVAALQFQDITRQRLQHISRTLHELSASRSVHTDAGLGRICRLQQEQLQWASEEFAAAIDRLEDNLQRMASEVQLLADETGAAVMAGGEEQSSRVEPSLQAVIECLQKVQTTHLAARQALFAVNQAVGDVALLTDEIEELGEEMQLLAQNAAISAAHGVRSGAGLTVIADNIQLLAEDAGRHARKLTDHCRQVSARAVKLDDLDRHYNGCDHELDSLLTDACTLSERLRSTDKGIYRQVDALGREARSLAVDLQQTLADFKVRESFHGAVTVVLAGLRELAANAGGDAGVEPVVEELSRRYTMMSQRRIHSQVMSGSTSVPGSELGDNVELF